MAKGRFSVYFLLYLMIFGTAAHAQSGGGAPEVRCFLNIFGRLECEYKWPKSGPAPLPGPGDSFHNSSSPDVGSAQGPCTDAGRKAACGALAAACAAEATVVNGGRPTWENAANELLNECRRIVKTLGGQTFDYSFSWELLFCDGKKVSNEPEICEYSGTCFVRVKVDISPASGGPASDKR